MIPRIDRTGAVLAIDLDAIASNYRMLCRRLKSACAAVVKADGYGLGAVPVSQRLREEGCRIFFVATLDEGLSLRAALGDAPSIFILNGVPAAGEGDAVAAKLTPVINSMEQLMRWRQEALLRGKRLAAALQIDTGMTRLGLTEEDVARLAEDWSVLAAIDPVLVMSHLACADDPLHPANEAQLATFERLRKRLPLMPASLANSSGIFLGDRYHLDLARPGVALYGINPMPGNTNPMQQAVAVQAQVIQLRWVQAGTAVGYGHMASTDRRTLLATISIGYADGWPRNASAGGIFRGQPLPLVGRVSMDSIVLDATGCATDIREGDMIEMIGSRQTVDDVAAAAGTIGYEILTRLGQRFQRHYVQKAALVT